MVTSNASIAIVTDDPGWHGRSLSKAFAKFGHAAHFVRLQDCNFNLGSDSTYLEIPGFAQLPQGVFVRGVSGGSLEQVIYYLDVLHALEAQGVPVVNNTRAIEKSVDKGMTSFLLRHKGIKTPDTFYSSDLHYIYEKIREGFALGKQYVLKPIFGSQGKGLQRLQNASDLIDHTEFHGVMYAQELIETGHHFGVDYRVFVVSDQVIACMRREGVDWISNVAQGATPQSVTLPENIQQLAIDAAKAIDMEYAGVDLIQNTQGEFWVTEVNSVPAWHGLQQTTDLPIAEIIAEHFLNRLN